MDTLPDLSVDLTPVVEAAARAAYDRKRTHFPDAPTWEQQTPMVRHLYSEAALPPVTVAAPLVRAATLRAAADRVATLDPMDTVVGGADYVAGVLRDLADAAEARR